MSKIVIALGGNALEEQGVPATAENQLMIVARTVKHIADIAQAGHQVMLTHGNGPQVGRILLQNDAAKEITPAMPFDVCGAESQGMLGYHIQQGLQNELRRRGDETGVAAIVTQVVVGADDPGFTNPTKPIGPFYSEEQARQIAAENPSFTMKEDAGRGWRRVVASPIPLRIVELAAVRALVATGSIVITVGGGGIPVIETSDGLQGVAAVIDKDHASSLLARDIDADILMVLTAVPQVYIRFGTPEQTALQELSVAEAEAYIAEGHFAPGSMLPKVQAAINFAKSKKGRRAIITSLDGAIAALAGKGGTTIVDN